MSLPSDIALLLIPVLPLLAALAGFTLRSLPPRAAAWLGTLSLLVSALLGGQLLLLGQGARFTRPWFMLPDGEILISSQFKIHGLAVPFQLDATVAQLLFLLTTALIAAAVLVFAMRERQGDPRARQFFATLTLFAGSMLLFVCADTLLLLYLAWELMGVCSYLLITHRGTNEARRAARQAFWTTRATDTGLLFAVLLLLMKFKWTTVSGIDIAGAFNALAQSAQAQNVSYLPVLEQAQVLLGVIALLLLLACVGKAAQLPLSFWLPDAMVAPAPVSALLHAATMVAAGPFLLIRCTSLFQPVSLPDQTQVLFAQQLPLLLAVLIGGLTLVLGGLMALFAQDPKRVLAYSTVSQLGLVVMSVGALSEEAGLYHLLAHAWFKAALFLAVGYIVLRALQPGHSHPDDAHSVALAGLAGAARQPLLRWTLLLAGLSLAGIWPLAGALGKEQVLHALLHRGLSEPRQGYVLGQYMHLAAAGWWIGAVLFLIALPITAAYITRLVGSLCFGHQPAPAQRDARPQLESAAAGTLAPGTAVARDWKLALGLVMALAMIGSIVWAVCYLFYQPAFSSGSTEWKWGKALSGASVIELLLSQLLVYGGVAAAWHVYVRNYKWVVSILTWIAHNKPTRRLVGTIALVSSVVWIAVWAFYVPSNFKVYTDASDAGKPDYYAIFASLLLGLLFIWAGARLVWYYCQICVDQVIESQACKPSRIATFFIEGMYLREVFTTAVGRTGAFLALLAGRTDTNVIDWLALRCGMGGRLLAGLARWVDDNIVDGARRLICASCWQLKRLHAVTMQNGQIQHYMFIILLAAVILCFAALGPLGKRLVQILGSR